MFANQPLSSFSFMPVRWCLRKRGSMEVRGDECEWKEGEHRKKEIIDIPLAPPPFSCLITVGLAGGEMPERGNPWDAVEGM